MRCRKVRRVLRYHVPNKHKFSEKFSNFGKRIMNLKVNSDFLPLVSCF